MSEPPLVWLPFGVDDLPADLRYEIVPNPSVDLPDSVGEVAFYVLPYRFAPGDTSFLERAASLAVVQTLSAGTEHVEGDIPDGVTLCNARGVHSASTAELAVTLTLASLRGVPGFVRDQDRQEWHQAFHPALADKRVLIVGAGDIGDAIADRLRPFETEIVMVARTARGDVHAVSELPDLVSEADVVILVVPLTDQTRHLVDADLLARMKHGSLLVNVARGGVVDTDALVEALHGGRISAALDVTDPEPPPPGHPLWTAPHLLMSPHVGGTSSAFWPRAHRLVRDQLRRYAAGEALANVVR